MSRDVQSLKKAFSTVRDFRQPRGRRYSLQAILMLTSLAMLDGAQSEQEVVTWTEHEGRRWLNLIGIRRRRGPSLATLHRVFRGIDRDQLSNALTEISGGSRNAIGYDRKLGGQLSNSVTPPERENFDLLNDTIGNLFDSKAGVDDDSQHISEAGLKIWAISLDHESNMGRGQ